MTQAYLGNALIFYNVGICVYVSVLLSNHLSVVCVYMCMRVGDQSLMLGVVFHFFVVVEVGSFTEPVDF